MVFDLHFPDDKGCCASFHVLIHHFHTFFEKMLMEVFCPFLNQVKKFFLLLSFRSFLFFWILIPYHIYGLQIFSPIL